MRILIIGAVALVAPASAAAPPVPHLSNNEAAPAELSTAPQARPFGLPDVRENGECRRPTAHSANNGADFRGDPVEPKRLTELPPAEKYMAVYRVIDGCEEPMTVTEYRRGISR